MFDQNAYFNANEPNQKIEQLLDTARGEIGVREDAGEDEDSAGRIAAYRAAVTSDGIDPNRGPEAWCANFVSWCFLQIDTPLGPTGEGFRSCTAMYKWFHQEAKWLARGMGQPSSGDVIFFDANYNGNPEHVGLIERIDGENLICIEGNYSNQVKRTRRNIHEKTIFGFGRYFK